MPGPTDDYRSSGPFDDLVRVVCLPLNQAADQPDVGFTRFIQLELHLSGWESHVQDAGLVLIRIPRALIVDLEGCEVAVDGNFHVSWLSAAVREHDGQPDFEGNFGVDGVRRFEPGRSL